MSSFFQALPLSSLWQIAKELFTSLFARYRVRCNPFETVAETTFENWLFIA